MPHFCKRCNTELLTHPAGDCLNWWVVDVIYNRLGIGYYGPPIDSSRVWQHDRSVRYATEDEVQAAYQKYWDAQPEVERKNMCGPEKMRFELCYWKEDWGPLLVDTYSNDSFSFGAEYLVNDWNGNIDIRRINNLWRVELWAPSSEYVGNGDTLQLAATRARLLAALEAA